MSECEIDKWGDKRWYNNRDELHREDGPACEYKSGERKWFINGKPHREGAPAHTYPSGEDGEEWYINGMLHREGGPAVSYRNGNKAWYINGVYHREDGPAIELDDGSKEWWYNGKRISCYSQEDFLKLIKLKAFW